MISAVTLSLSKINRSRLFTLVPIILFTCCISPPHAIAQATSDLSSRINEDLRQVHDAEQQHLSNAQRGFAWATLAADYRDAAEFTRAEDAYNRSISLLKGAPEAAINYATALDNLGALYLLYGHSDEALICMKKGLAVREKLGNQAHIAMSLQHIADLDIAFHRFKDAEKEAAQAYQIVVTTNTPPPTTIAVLATLAYSRCKQNKCAQGLHDAENAVAVARTFIPSNSFQYGLTLITLGFAQYRTNQFNEAERSLLSGIQIVKAQTTPGDPTLFYSMREYLDYLKAAHRDAEAKQLETQLANSNIHQPCATCSVSVYSLSNAMR